MSIEVLNYTINTPGGGNHSWREGGSFTRRSPRAVCLAPLIREARNVARVTKYADIEIVIDNLIITPECSADKLDQVISLTESVAGEWQFNRRQNFQHAGSLYYRTDYTKVFYTGKPPSWHEFYALVCLYHQINEYSGGMILDAARIAEECEIEDIPGILFMLSGCQIFWGSTDTIHVGSMNYSAGHWFCAHSCNFHYDVLKGWIKRLESLENPPYMDKMPRDFDYRSNDVFFLPDSEADPGLQKEARKFKGKPYNKQNFTELYNLLCK